ncbi:hypothetical protein [Streptomyces formicae]|uniref:Uncharacterized protein n=1 Tax=Streptomyces formicae TaxID=1616117 RepID=A0ABY3WR86_9ACTN|nr:hypothetical protein [Streptomyces formicae]UNM12323.1 hypothetical protein J4032_12960 [Streptomyces formicae]
MCRSGCKTQNHATWGECARAANMRIAYCGVAGGDASAQKRWDDELDLYRQARRQGIQPDSTNRPDVERALTLSEQAGAAYGRDFAVATPVEA